MRLSKAKNEMKSASKFEHIIHNDELNKAEQELQALVTDLLRDEKNSLIFWQLQPHPPWAP